MLAVWRGEHGGGRWAWGGRISYLLGAVDVTALEGHVGDSVFWSRFRARGTARALAEVFARLFVLSGGFGRLPAPASRAGTRPAVAQARRVTRPRCAGGPRPCGRSSVARGQGDIAP